MKQSITSLFDLYLAASGNRDSSIACKRRAFKFFSLYLGDMDIESVKFGHAETFATMLYKNGRCEKTVNQYIGHLRHFFDWAMKSEYVTRNPFALIPRLPEQDKFTEPFTIEEIDRMVQVADKIWKPIILLGAFSGLRRAEVLNLILNDLRYDEQMIRITPKKQTSETWNWNIKNRKEAFVPFPETVFLPSGQAHYHTLVIAVTESLAPGQPYPFVKPRFYQKNLRLQCDGKLTYEERLCPWGNFDRDFKTIQKRALVKLRPFRALRVAFGNILNKCGYDLKAAQQLFRHTSINTTARYYRKYEQRELVAKANKSLKSYGT